MVEIVSDRVRVCECVWVRQGVYLKRLSEWEIINYCQSIGLQVIETEIKNGNDWVLIAESNARLREELNDFKLWEELRD